jgi:hypothetical protein
MTVDECTERALRSDFPSASRLERRWANWMQPNEEAVIPPYTPPPKHILPNIMPGALLMDLVGVATLVVAHEALGYSAL